MIYIIILLLVIYLLNNNYEGFETCEYREKGKGNMCKEKWGEPHCIPWTRIDRLTKILSNISGHSMKGYDSNNYNYSLDYERGEGENEPRSVNSTFFS